MIQTLTRFEWVQQPEPGVRMKFRKDGTGYYEREGAAGTRFTHDNLLYRLEEKTLHLKFAHARQWMQIGIEMAEGSANEQERLGRMTLTLAHDPYVALFEERLTQALVLLSDSGAALLG